eukprot:CAMPEP_0196784712 /NCGR_PEP_ID=MMETSP1104-20130614/17642_1 /TAXON_ID=33652 /ORGANISM="Cafeteria sp., Strain Caron Lab Isolate" /LENGTH=45 /DNA_ID= /DNA_START= /DNA_END= /DNA_ORIENTATION=
MRAQCGGDQRAAKAETNASQPRRALRCSRCAENSCSADGGSKKDT